MKEVKICYSSTQNLGDLINPLIVEQILGYKPVLTDAIHCQTSGIGSGLYRYFSSRSRLYKSPKNILKYMESRFTGPLQIWSAGFIEQPAEDAISWRKKVNVSSTRGKLSKKYLEKILKRKIECVTGDAGILAANLVNVPDKKSYSLGIIPHISERTDKRIAMLAEAIPGSIIIDVTAEPMESLKIMSKCSTIVSSSLHGLIIADGMHIPNRQFNLNNNLYGDGMKFADYYSNYDIEPVAMDLGQNLKVDIDEIKAGYSISGNIIENSKKALKETFSYYL